MISPVNYLAGETVDSQLLTAKRVAYALFHCDGPHRRASPEFGETLDEEVLVRPEVDVEQRDVVRLVDPVQGVLDCNDPPPLGRHPVSTRSTG